MKSYMNLVEEGAKIIINDWMKLKEEDKLLIVTSDKYDLEASMLKKYALKKNAYVDIMVVRESGIHVGVYFDENDKVFDDYSVIIGATDYSIVTTRAAERAIAKGSKFLSLPLSVRNKESMLSYDFIRMDTKKSKLMAEIIMSYIHEASMIQITTDIGTDLRVYKKNRDPGFFNGVAKDGGGFSSASFEIYVPIEENKSEGIMMVDASLGYIGVPKEPVKLDISEGRITRIEQNESGIVLRNYIEEYNDPKMYISSEFGIGLNSYAKSKGNSYIEDESAYGTFHLGFGRNIALGGVLDANGHFDLVGLEPNIYADNRKIMERGRIIVPEPRIY